MTVGIMAGSPDLKVEAGVSLRTLAVARIRTEISEGRMAPGTRLVERDLCAALGVSRTVIREAIRQLEAEGYVAQAPRRGPIVAPLDRETIRSIYEVREVLEAQAAALFIARAGEADRAQVAAISRRLETFETGGDHIDGLAVLDELHHAILAGCGNAMFGAILTPLTGRIHMLRVQAARSPERRPVAFRQLMALAQALCDGDAEAAVATARTRLRDAAAFAIAQHEMRVAEP